LAAVVVGVVVAAAAANKARTRVAGRDHDGDALGGKLGQVGVDDGEVSGLAPDLFKVALPAV
jgi:hypothetical protein